MFFKYTDDQIKEKVNIAIGMLFKGDSFLLENGVNERSVSHKLAEYLQTLFSDYNVDCEYNKKGLDTKTLDGIKECEEQRKTDRVFPDIIVHTRNSNDNLIVIEIKTISKNENCDLCKLSLFTDLLSSNGYKYQLGIFIKFNKLDNPIIRYFKNGKID